MNPRVQKSILMLGVVCCSCFHLTSTLLAVQAACDISGATPLSFCRRHPRAFSSMRPESAAPTAAATTEMAILLAVPPEFEIPARLLSCWQGIIPSPSGPEFHIHSGQVCQVWDRFSCSLAQCHRGKEMGPEGDQLVPRCDRPSVLEGASLSSKEWPLHRPRWWDPHGRGHKLSVLWNQIRLERAQRGDHPESEFIEHVVPIVESMGKYIFQTYQKDPAHAMNKCICRQWDPVDHVWGRGCSSVTDVTQGGHACVSYAMAAKIYPFCKAIACGSHPLNGHLSWMEQNKNLESQLCYCCMPSSHIFFLWKCFNNTQW